MPTTTITNYSHFFNSADIKVFPCQNRGLIYNNENTSIGINDPEARMLSEYNFTHTTTDYMQSYAITKGNFDEIAEGKETFCFVIGGYYFKLKFTDTNESSEINTRKEKLKSYFHVRLRPVYIKETNVEPSTTRTSQELAPIVDKDGEVLLTSLDHNNKFYGIGLSREEASSSSTYVIRFFDDNGNFIFTTLRPELSHGEQDNSTKIGNNLIASKTNQTAIGEYNTSNDEAVFIVGNGIADATNNSIEVKTGALQINNDNNSIMGKTNTITGETNIIQAEINNIIGTTNTIAATDKNIIKLNETNYIEQATNLTSIKNTNIKLDGILEITDNTTINAGKTLVVDTIESNTSSEQLNIGNSQDIQISTSGIACATTVKMNKLTFNYQKDGINSATGISFIFPELDSSLSIDPVTEQTLFNVSRGSNGAKLSYSVPEKASGILRLALADDSSSTFKLTTPIDINNSKEDKDIISVNGKNGCEIFRGLKVYKNDESTELISATENGVVLCTGTKVGEYQIATIGDTKQNGKIYATSFYAKSDRRLKENIEDTKFDAESILDKIKIRDFTWKADEQHKQQVGVIAQELAEVMPEEIKDCFVDTTSETFSVSESKLVYLLIKAYQEEKAKRIEIENRLNKLEGRN